MPLQIFNGCAMFRERIAASLISGKGIRIQNIRSEYNNTAATTRSNNNNSNSNDVHLSALNEVTAIGLQDYEASYLRLIDRITDGTVIEINETGTTLKFKPGLILGGNISHDCGTKRSIGWFIEGILPLIIFGKENFHGHFTGITNDGVDLSVDTLKQATLPLLYHFGVTNISLKTHKRGSPPNGGGAVELSCGIIREIKPVDLVQMGLVRRVRGTAYCSKISPTVLTRVIDSTRGVLNKFLPDVYIHTDHYKGAAGGHSPGYSLYLAAETTSGMQLTVERTASARGGELPESVGEEAAFMLLDEIDRAGCVDASHQVLVLQLMVMGPEDIARVRFGREVSRPAVEMLRIMREMFGVVFKLKVDYPARSAGTATATGVVAANGANSSDAAEADVDVDADADDTAAAAAADDDVGAGDTATVLVSCLGIGHKNISRKIR